MQQITSAMCVIGFRTADGGVTTGQANSGSLMELALALGVRGIEGQCGGYVACGTCHIHIPDEWIDRIGRATPDEVTMLEYEPSYTPHSRLSCQIAVRPELDGLVVDVQGVR